MRALRLMFAAVVVSTIFIISGTVKAQTSLDPMLDPYLARYDLPAIAAAVVMDGKVISAGAVGTRRVGTKIPVTINDPFHLGSDTKAMTALLAAMLVEEGKLRWGTTVSDVFPELAEKMDPRLRRVTLEQLLSHTGGIQTDNEEIVKVCSEALTRDGNLDELRYWVVQQWSKRPLEFEPGTTFAYANMGYVIIGAMIERIGKKTWDEIMTERIFVPLKLGTAGLGPQSSLGRVDAPLGHLVVGGKAKAMLAGPNGDVPAVIGPAGIAHMSILDFAGWAGWNAGEGKRGPALLKPETMRKLHTPVISMPKRKDAAPGTPPGGKYALGWGQLAVDWAPRPLLFHGGSNTMNLAHIWVDTKRDFAMVIAANIGGQKADAAFFALARELYAKFAEERK
jgi:CubicO group peptidase (beta-lactamase class C family)